MVSKDAMQILKYHGSYMQTNRETKVKDYQFMLRLKQPAGELPPELYRLLDDLSNKYGQGDLRCTTRQCFQVHGILKGNVMTTPAPFNTTDYIYANEWSKIFAQLFRPMTPAYSEIWLDGNKAASIETWSKDVEHLNVDKAILNDSGRGIILADKTEPLYGDRYLPRKFKIGVTVPG